MARFAFSGRAAGTDRAGSALSPIKPDADHLIAPAIFVGGPPATHLSLRTRSSLLLPVNLKLALVISRRLFGLPTRVGAHRTHNGDLPLRLAADHPVDIAIP